MVIIYILYLVIFLVISVFAMICIKIKASGMNIRDFFEFVLAINDLDNLYLYSKNKSNMTKSEQNIFLIEAEKLFSNLKKYLQ